MINLRRLDSCASVSLSGCYYASRDVGLYQRWLLIQHVRFVCYMLRIGNHGVLTILTSCAGVLAAQVTEREIRGEIHVDDYIPGNSNLIITYNATLTIIVV